MKTATPPHPHTADLKRFEDPERNPFYLVAVQFMVPSRVAALLPERGALHVITAANIGLEKYLNHRARCWKAHAGSKRQYPALKNEVAAMIEEGCDTEIMLALPVQEWHLVGMLCGKLGITPGQWFLACAAYNARIEEESLSRMLADIPPAPVSA